MTRKPVKAFLIKKREKQPQWASEVLLDIAPSRHRAIAPSRHRAKTPNIRHPAPTPRSHLKAAKTLCQKTTDRSTKQLPSTTTATEHLRPPPSPASDLPRHSRATQPRRDSTAPQEERTAPAKSQRCEDSLPKMDSPKHQPTRPPPPTASSSAPPHQAGISHPAPGRLGFDVTPPLRKSDNRGQTPRPLTTCPRHLRHPRRLAPLRGHPA